MTTNPRLDYNGSTLGFLLGDNMSDIHRKQLENLGSIKVTKIKEKKDGSAKITFSVNEDFIRSYNEFYHLAEWDQKHFEQTMISAVGETIVKESRKNEQDPDFLWSLPKDNNE